MREAGFDIDSAVEMMFNERKNKSRDRSQRSSKQAMTNNRDLALDMILLHVDKRLAIDIYGADWFHKVGLGNSSQGSKHSDELQII